ncbi:hypothetical protein P7C73_g4905, partial [Tremellales sp. Uapishka_1]
MSPDDETQQPRVDFRATTSAPLPANSLASLGWTGHTSDSPRLRRSAQDDDDDDQSQSQLKWTQTQLALNEQEEREKQASMEEVSESGDNEKVTGVLQSKRIANAPTPLVDEEVDELEEPQPRAPPDPENQPEDLSDIPSPDG